MNRKQRREMENQSVRVAREMLRSQIEVARAFERPAMEEQAQKALEKLPGADSAERVLASARRH